MDCDVSLKKNQASKGAGLMSSVISVIAPPTELCSHRPHFEVDQLKYECKICQQDG